MSKMRTVRRATTWVLQGLLALAFVLVGVAKLGSEMWVQNFIGWGYPPAFLYVVAFAEIVLGVLVAIPRTARIALTGIVVLMLGAATTHLRAGDPPAHLIGPIVYITVASIVWGLRRPLPRERQAA